MSRTGPGLARNWISMTGIVVVTISAVLFLSMFLLDLFGYHANPYIGIIFFLIIPAFFVGGLLLIPIGMWLERRRRLHGRPSHMHWPRLDLNDPIHRRTTFGVLVLTMINVIVVSLAAYRGIEFMDSPAFCGEVCHEVMAPQYAAFEDGPHARVSCVRCHIGPGAPWFVRSKLDGARQVVAVMLDSHSRPIPTPVHNLRPAREVCEQCHWPEKFHGDKIVMRYEYGNDEEVTESVTEIRIHVGGGSEKLGVAAGIHWHMNVANEVEYIAIDDRREDIRWVRVRDRQGNVREYVDADVTPEQLAQGERRLMDCMDCHNRPSHTFYPSAEAAVDAAIASGEIPRLPFVRREAVAALTASHTTQDAAMEDIATRLEGFYRSYNGDVYADRQADIQRTIETARRLYSRNVFPSMNVTWGTYPNHIGHTTAAGCFRCHDDTKQTKDGRTISMDCTLCHSF